MKSDCIPGYRNSGRKSQWISTKIVLLLIFYYYFNTNVTVHLYFLTNLNFESTSLLSYTYVNVYFLDV